MIMSIILIVNWQDSRLSITPINDIVINCGYKILTVTVTTVASKFDIKINLPVLPESRVTEDVTRPVLQAQSAYQ